jgi:glycosyltransferase involved in cell wall biosynthesis
VSPGNVGLTAIQSLAYGTPVCTHNNFNNQMPEANSIKEGYNGTFFKENNLESLVETISKWKYDKRKLISKNCINTIGNKYNFKNQIKIFEKHLL